MARKTLAPAAIAAGPATSFLAASSAFNFSQYVIFMDTRRKRALHEACVKSYAEAAPTTRTRLAAGSR